MSKKIKTVEFNAPERFEYAVRINTDREKDKFIKRIEAIVRSSMEYKDYISYLKESFEIK